MKCVGINPLWMYFYNDRMFDLKNGDLGQNMLEPYIKLKAYFEHIGYEFHTIDMINLNKADILIFQDVPINSICTINRLVPLMKYILKNKRKIDFFKYMIDNNLNTKAFLIMQEPPLIDPFNYNKKFHKYFNKIFTWCDDLVDNKKYFKLCYPQPLQKKTYEINFDYKKLCVMIASNKRVRNKEFKYELYSKRKKVIDYFESNNKQFDLYGYGWNDKISFNELGKWKVRGGGIKTIKEKQMISLKLFQNINSVSVMKICAI